MIVEWTATAEADAAAIVDFISVDDPAAAREIVARIRATATRLAEHPFLGRPGRHTGTRELIVPGTPYIVPYAIVGQRLRILRVWHAARDWPPRL